MPGTYFKMRARDRTNAVYLTWIVQDTADSAGIYSPTLILPGTASVVATWTEDLVIQTARTELFTILQTSTPETVAPDPGTDIVFVLVDTSAWTPNGRIHLPGFPLSGGRVTVKDRTGSAATRPIVVAGNGNLIQGRANDTLSVRFASRTYLYDAVEWKLI
jgi:hypothetical protein